MEEPCKADSTAVTDPACPDLVKTATQASQASPTTNANQTRDTTRQLRKKKMSDEEVQERLKGIVTIGDPNDKYRKIERIGQGCVCDL